VLIEYEEKTYDFEMDNISVQQLKTIFTHLDGLTLGALENGIPQGDPNALIALYWLMLENNDEHVPIDQVDFKVIKFFKAFRIAADKEREKEQAAAKAAAKAGIPQKKE
jgi:hypothetical protein